MSDQDKIKKLIAVPTLKTCLLVDSRFSSRRQILADLEETKMFEDVVVASSLEAGLEEMVAHQANSCVIGPSVTINRAMDFIERGRELPTPESGKTAFIGIVRPDQPEAQLIFAESLDGLMEYPYAKEILTETLLESVAKAVPDGPWAKFLATVNDRKPEVSALSLAMWEAASSSLKEIALGVRTGIYGLDSVGRITIDTENAIRMLTAQCLRGHSDTPDYRRFKDFVTECIREWTLDTILESEASATSRLKEKLLSFN